MCVGSGNDSGEEAILTFSTFPIFFYNEDVFFLKEEKRKHDRTGNYEVKKTERQELCPGVSAPSCCLAPELSDV